jgi:hypothetical protein
MMLLAISGGMFKLAALALKKVCVGLERVIDEHGVEQIVVEYMTLLGRHSRQYLREDCEGSRDTKVSQNFAVLDSIPTSSHTTQQSQHLENARSLHRH